MISEIRQNLLKRLPFLNIAEVTYYKQQVVLNLIYELTEQNMKISSNASKADRKNSKHSHASVLFSETQRSLSNDKIRKNQTASFIFNNVKSSVCYIASRSPRHVISDHQRNSYMNFVESGRVSNMQTRRNSFAFQTRKVKTPTQRRSLGSVDRKNEYFNSKVVTKRKNTDALNSSQPLKKIKVKNQLFIKGKEVKRESSGHKTKHHLFQNVKIQKQSIDKGSKKHLNTTQTLKPKKKATKSHNKTLELDASQKLMHEEEKLLKTLFKGIEFYRSLGKGAHATVKSAVDWNNDRKIAIKTYPKESISQQQIRNIEREIQILMCLDHRSIIKLYEIIQSYKTINLIMEYGGGNSLDQFMRSKTEGFLSQRQAAKIFVQVLGAVKELESKSIAHRDLKPENILLNKHLEVKLIDFGFALKCHESQQVSTYFGTPTYMAPEVASKKPHNPNLSDRWSLGILLYSMLNGACPFKASTQQGLFQKISQGQYSYLVNLSQEATELIESFLVLVPEERISIDSALASKWISKLQHQ